MPAKQKLESTELMHNQDTKKDNLLTDNLYITRFHSTQIQKYSLSKWFTFDKFRLKTNLKTYSHSSKPTRNSAVTGLGCLD